MTVEKMGELGTAHLTGVEGISVVTEPVITMEMMTVPVMAWSRNRVFLDPD